MKLPLAILLYENLMPGSQLISRLQDLGYRVQSINDARLLVEVAQREKALVVIADLFSTKAEVCKEIKALKTNPATSHIPIVAFADANQRDLQKAATASGANLVASNLTILAHLPQFLDQALQID
jgi:CheY-like chemotaxis protein